jgi:hypothetical protein
MTAQQPLNDQPRAGARPTTWRIAVTWIGIAILVGGNLADWANWFVWGPGQTGGDRTWILFSAALFWLSFATLVVLGYDVVATWLEPGHVPPPTTTLIGPGPIPQIADWIRRFSAKRHALLGLAGLLAGAVIGHLMWKP